MAWDIPDDDIEEAATTPVVEDDDETTRILSAEKKAVAVETNGLEETQGEERVLPNMEVNQDSRPTHGMGNRTAHRTHISWAYWEFPLYLM